MTNPLSIRRRFGLTLLFALALPFLAQATEALPSWNDGPSKKNIIEFVQAVTDQSSKDFVKPEDRIAVFDNDGTLWSEQPMYFEMLFALEEVKRTAPQHPEWKTTQPFQAVLENDHKALAASGLEGMMKIFGATHTGMTSEAFDDYAKTWLSQAKHPKTGKLYTEMVFQPMLEVLDYLREQNFKTYIVSGGDTDFIRAFAEKVYGVPPEQVIGTSFVTTFQYKDGKASILRTPKLAHYDDGPGKPESINAIIGKRPILAFGNSDGDLQMLQWTTAGKGARLGLIVHHTDAVREYAYDRKSPIGRLDKALDVAKTRDWTVVDMAAEWRRIYPYDAAAPEQVR